MMQLLYNIVFDALPIITLQGKVITGYAGQGLTLKKKGLKHTSTVLEGVKIDNRMV